MSDNEERGNGSLAKAIHSPLLFFSARRKFCLDGKNVGKLLELAHSCSRMNNVSGQIKISLGEGEIGSGQDE